MSRYAAFLRGINVSGRRATGPQLCAAFTQMGLADPATFRASGNVVFAAQGKADRLAALIEQGLKEAFGFEVTTFVRSAREIKAIAAHQPFDPKLVDASQGKLQVALLASKPTARGRKQMLALSTAEDRLAIHGRELYWLPAGGLAQSRLGMAGIEPVLGPNTVRTKGTIEQLTAKYFGD
jgi:uncharacterized protein (DUF1697 family)